MYVSHSDELHELVTLLLHIIYLLSNILWSFSLAISSKYFGIQPIVVCEVACRIIAKAALSSIQDDIKEVANSHQLYASQIAGVEAPAQENIEVVLHAVYSALTHVDIPSRECDSLTLFPVLLGTSHL